MTDFLGQILLWGGASVLFPTLCLPAALLLAGARNKAVMPLWAGLVFGLGAVGAVFCYLAVDLAITLSTQTIGLWAVMTALFIGATPIFFGGAQNAAQRLSALFEKTARMAGYGVAILAIAMALVQFALVILRYIFGVNFIWLQEGVAYMHAALFLIPAGYALLSNDHVRVDIFYRDAPERRKAWVNFLGAYFFLFPFVLLTLWTASPYVGDAWRVGEVSTEATGLQIVYLLKSLIPLFAVLLAFAGFSVATRAVETLKGGAR